MILSNVGIIASSGVVIPPVNTVAPTISGTNAVGNMLTATNGTWTGTSISYTYQWKRDGVNIPSATSITYTLVQADAGYNITCQVTGTNAAGTANALSNSLLCYDANAYAYNTATNLTATTQTVAINELVLDLKSAGIWTKMKAVYPMITDKVTQVDIATQMKFNLINPADTNAAFRLSWNGGWTYASTGVTPSGTGFANTNLNPSTQLTLNNTHLSIYSRTSTANFNWLDFGNTIPPSQFSISSGYANVAYSDSYNYNTGRVSVSNTDAKGFYVQSRTLSNSHKFFKNGVQFGATNTGASGSFTNLNIYIGALNDNGTAQYYTIRQYAFASIGDGLTDTESQLFYQIVEKYQFTLSRNTNPTQSFYYNRNYNSETNIFLFTSQITNSTMQTAVNGLVNDLKTYSLWTKMKVIYPMVGGTAFTHSLNLVTPNTFSLGFNGGWTHDSLGAKPNGINGFATTGLTTPNSQFSVGSVHQSYYNVTNSSGGGAFPTGKTEIGSGSTNTVMSMGVGTDTNKSAGGACGGFVGANANLGSGADVRGFVNVSRTSTTLIKSYKNGVVLASNTAAVSNLPFTGDLNIACNYFSDGSTQRNQYSDRQAAFISFGSGLTDAEAANFYLVVQNYQTALGRQVV
jgi:hypothetical protein